MEKGLQVMLAQNTSPAPGGVAEGEELPNMVGKLVEGVAGGGLVTLLGTDPLF